MTNLSRAPGMVLSMWSLCRVSGGYPEAPCAICIKDTKGLSVVDKRALSKALHRALAQHAQQEEVCAFNLVEICQVGSGPLASTSCMHATHMHASTCLYVTDLCALHLHRSSCGSGTSHPRMRRRRRRRCHCGTTCSGGTGPAAAAAVKQGRMGTPTRRPGAQWVPGASSMQRTPQQAPQQPSRRAPHGLHCGRRRALLWAA